MTNDEFRSLLKSAGLSQRALASRLGLNVSTVNRWSTGDLDVPQYAIAYLDLWCGAKELASSNGLELIHPNPPLM